MGVKTKNFQIVKEQRVAQGARENSWLIRGPGAGDPRRIGRRRSGGGGRPRAGGASRDRTGDLLVANQTLSQLSYGPT